MRYTYETTVSSAQQIVVKIGNAVTHCGKLSFELYEAHGKRQLHYNFFFKPFIRCLIYVFVVSIPHSALTPITV